MNQATQEQTTEQILLRTGLRARRDTLRADLFATRGRPAPEVAPEQRLARQGGYCTPEWLERSFVLPIQPRPGWPVSAVPAAPGLAERMAQARRPAHAAPIDFAALVHRGEVFRRWRTTALACAVLGLAILLAYAGTGLPALLPTLCLVAAGGIGATYVAIRLVNAPLPRVGR